jgi:hypothetical protein
MDEVMPGVDCATQCKQMGLVFVVGARVALESSDTSSMLTLEIVNVLAQKLMVTGGGGPE